MASLGHLAAGVAHEINNPVAVVYSNIATLSEYLSELISLAEEYQHAEDKINDNEMRLALEKMREAIDLAFVKDDGPELISASKHSLERVRNIISELRTFADSDSLEREKVRLNDLLREAVRTVDGCQRDEIRLITLVEESLEVEVVPSQVRLILGKILENACEAMPAGGNIEIASEVDDANINLVIKDSGCGMSAGELEKAINPFYSSKAVGEGTGLGLTVAYNLMLNQGGELSMASEEGHGTMVVLKFPRDNVLF
nr:ATP-binding protein [Thalassolituus sp.]